MTAKSKIFAKDLVKKLAFMLAPLQEIIWTVIQFLYVLEDKYIFKPFSDLSNPRQMANG